MGFILPNVAMSGSYDRRGFCLAASVLEETAGSSAWFDANTMSLQASQTPDSSRGTGLKWRTNGALPKNLPGAFLRRPTPPHRKQRAAHLRVFGLLKYQSGSCASLLIRLASQ
jgi:hypothetical protein